MKHNPGQFPPRTAPESDLQETLVGTALALGVFAVLFGTLLFPAVGVAAVALLVVALLVRFGRSHPPARPTRRGRPVRFEGERSRSEP